MELWLVPLAKEQLGISAPAPMSVRSQYCELAMLSSFFVLTKSKPAGCCVLAGHVLILGQGWPCVFILPDGMVLFFFFSF